MSKYNYVLFDLDGTITEPALGITNGVIHALKKLGISVEDRASLYKFIGPPLRDSFREFYGMDEATAEIAVGYYREYYKDKGLEENELMPHMEATLITLHNAGIKLYVATSKPQKFAKIILDKLGVLKYFQIVAGASFDSTRDTKELVMEYLLDQIRHKEDAFTTEKAIMVGDRLFDIHGAKCFNMDSVGVTFGYGGYDELKSADATYIIDNARELINIVI